MCREPADGAMAFGIVRGNEPNAILQALDAGSPRIMKDLLGLLKLDKE